MNICRFSIKLPILEKISPIVMKYRHLINGLHKFTVSRSVLSCLQSMEVDSGVSIDALAKQKQNGV